MTSKFAIHKNAGFTLTFDDDVTLSVRFSPHHNCANNTEWGMGLHEPFAEEDTFECINAEVAIFEASTEGSTNRNWRTQHVFQEVFDIDIHDDVAGYVSVSEVADIISYLNIHHSAPCGEPSTKRGTE